LAGLSGSAAKYAEDPGISRLVVGTVGGSIKTGRNKISRPLKCLKNGEIAQQRNYSDHDDDDPHDLFCTGIQRQHLDKVKNKKDHQNGDQKTDQYGHFKLPVFGIKAKVA
jgi:hypothetical protein